MPQNVPWMILQIFIKKIREINLTEGGLTMDHKKKKGKIICNDVQYLAPPNVVTKGRQKR